MALRSPALYMGNPAINHTAQNDRLSKAGLIRADPAATAANRPLASVSGVLAAPDGTMGEVTLLSNAQFTVNPARWYLYSTDSASGGTYEVTNDAVETLAVTAQDASQYRKAYFGVWVIDSNVVGSGDDLPHWGLQNGPLAASNPALPASGTLPENFLALGEFLIPPTGQAVTYTAYEVRTGLRGGILRATATDTRPGAHVGSYRDHPAYGLQRYGTRWGAPVQAPAPPLTGAWPEPAGQFGVSPSQLTSLAIPDPGRPYCLQVEAYCEMGSAAAGSRWDLSVRVSGGGLGATTDIGLNIAQIELTAWQRVLTPVVSDLVLTGPSTVLVMANRGYGTGNGNITAFNKRVRAYVWPAQ